MFIVVVYHRETKKVILCMPFVLSGDVKITQNTGLVYNGYDYRVFCNMEPVLYEDKDGDICLRDNALIVNGEDLK